MRWILIGIHTCLILLATTCLHDDLPSSLLLFGRRLTVGPYVCGEVEVLSDPIAYFLAEAGGFEPPRPLRVYLISSQARSTTLARFQEHCSSAITSCIDRFSGYTSRPLFLPSMNMRFFFSLFCLFFLAACGSKTDIPFPVPP